MRKLLIAAVSVTIILLFTSCSPDPGNLPEISVFGPKSDFVFRGQIRILHTSTIDSPDAETMGVVLVVEIVHGPESLASSRGRDVTVRFVDINSMSAADDLLMFTNIAVLGNEIGLTEVASLPWDQSRFAPAALKEDLVGAIGRRDDEALREQVRSSQSVVLGQVIRTSPVKVEGARDTEHDPMWTEAVVQVEEQMKGDSVETVTFVFSASNDVAWYVAPKFNEGDRGVFLLRTHENVTQAKDRLALIHETEFRAERAEIDKIREHTKGLRQ